MDELLDKWTPKQEEETMQEVVVEEVLQPDENPTPKVKNQQQEEDIVESVITFELKSKVEEVGSDTVTVSLPEEEGEEEDKFEDAIEEVTTESHVEDFAVSHSAAVFATTLEKQQGICISLVEGHCMASSTIVGCG